MIKKQVTKRQHWLPRMRIKRWLYNDMNKEKIDIYQKDSKTSYAITKGGLKKNKDPFWDFNFYEGNSLSINVVEDLLSWLEGETSEVMDKICQDTGNNLYLSNKDILLIKVFIYTSGIRCLGFKNRLLNLEGNENFITVHKSKSKIGKENNFIGEIYNVISATKATLDDENNKTKIWSNLKSIVDPFQHMYGKVYDFLNDNFFFVRTPSNFVLGDLGSASVSISNSRKSLVPLTIFPISNKLSIIVIHTSRLEDLWHGVDLILSSKMLIKNLFQKFDYEIKKGKFKISNSLDDVNNIDIIDIDFLTTNFLNERLIKISDNFIIHSDYNFKNHNTNLDNFLIQIREKIPKLSDIPEIKEMIIKNPYYPWNTQIWAFF